MADEKEKVEKFVEYIKQNPEKTIEATRKKLYEYIFLEEKQKKDKDSFSPIEFATKLLYKKLKEEIDYYVEHYRFMSEIRFFVKIK